MLDREGGLKYFLGMHRDVTKVHELEQALRQQKARIETVLDAAPVIVVLLDADGRVVLDNQEYKKLSRRPARAGASGSSARRAPVPGRHRPVGRVSERTGLQGSGSQSSRPPEPADPAGSPAPARRPTSWTRAPAASSAARLEGEHRLLLLANEVTARRREIERAHLENLRARLAEQQLMHGMREALAAAIYQIQAPINVINAAAALVRGGSANLETLVGLLEQISAAGTKALATLQAALPEEPREAGVMVNVNELLRQVLELETDRLLASGVVVDWRPANQLPELPGHKNSLRSLFKHLIDNAIHALAESRRSHRELHLATRALDGAVEVDIQDNGPGIPLEDRYRVFEPFSHWLAQPPGQGRNGPSPGSGDRQRSRRQHRGRPRLQRRLPYPRDPQCRPGGPITPIEPE